MHKDFVSYSKDTFRKTGEAMVNLSMFIPYYFSITQLVRTLFAPWKNIITVDDKPGFSLDRFLKKAGDNFASRLIGFMVRSSILLMYVIVQVGYVIALPIVALIVIIGLPLSYVFYTITPTDSEKKNEMFNNFMKRHLADQKNQQAVLEWFDIYYKNSQQKPWWAIEKLFSQPPLGRDLTSGFTNTLDQFSTELTLQQPHHKHLIGRQEELKIIERILSKSNEANVLLNGEVGVGKHAIIETLAKAIYEGSVNNQLAYKRILELDIDAAISQVNDFVEREEVLSRLLAEAAQAKNVIIVINNIDHFISDEPGKLNFTSVLTEFASTPNIQFIVTTTPYNYQKFVFPNKEILNVFDKVDIHEVTAEQTLRILLDVAPDIERKHGVHIVYEALRQAVYKTERYINSAPFPEKAIELLDDACLYAREHSPGGAVDAHIINTVLEQKTNVPTEVDQSMKTKLLHLEEQLSKRVLFQDKAMKALAAALRKAFVNIGSHTKPLASFMFLGPTGVGKTETAKAVTEVFFEDSDAMIRLDMANFQSKLDIDNLIGSPDTNEPGQLTTAIRNKRYGTLLLDELEKAHKDLLNIFLTILDEGYFTDGFGKRVDCSNLIIIATSNAGADFIYSNMSTGLHTEDISKALVDHLIEAGTYSPEFLNRFDGIIVYKPLYKESMKEITKRMVQDIAQKTKQDHNIILEFSEGFIDNLVEKGYDPRFGARNMQRLIESEVEDSISKAVLEGNSSGKVLKF